MHGGGVGGGAAFDEPDELRDPWQVGFFNLYFQRLVPKLKRVFDWNWEKAMLAIAAMNYVSSLHNIRPKATQLAPPAD